MAGGDIRGEKRSFDFAHHTFRPVATEVFGFLGA
jgi:hypothetical protein